MSSRRRVGIVGFGHLGQYLVDAILGRQDQYELAFVWSRGKSPLEGRRVDAHLILDDLSQFHTRRPDLVVEVAHPGISKQYGVQFLKHADYLMGSPTALADPEVEMKLRRASSKVHGLYIPSGALWGLDDIKKMADLQTLKGLTITMRKHPSSLKLEGPLKTKVDTTTTKPVVLYEGPVRDICNLAPNNVNTMAAASIAAHNLGFDATTGILIADPSLNDYHVVEVDVMGPSENGRTFTVRTIRSNPAHRGAVTGSATYGAFLSSMLAAHGKGTGIHLC